MSDLDLTDIKKAIADMAAHQHGREDWYCLNLVSWLGERARFLVKEIEELRERLTRAEDHILAREAQLGESAEEIDRLRAELADCQDRPWQADQGAAPAGQLIPWKRDDATSGALPADDLRALAGYVEQRDGGPAEEAYAPSPHTPEQVNAVWGHTAAHVDDDPIQDAHGVLWDSTIAAQRTDADTILDQLADKTDEAVSEGE